MSESGLYLTPATPDDAENLLRLHKLARYKTEMELAPEYAQMVVDSGYYEHLWRRIFTRATDAFPVIKAESGSRLVGFCRFGALDRKEHYDEKLGGLMDGLGELHVLCVDKRYRVKYGVGRALYHAAREGLSRMGFRHMLMSIVESNSGASVFYEKMGARHAYSYLATLEHGDKTAQKMVAVYVHRDIG